MTSRNCIHCGHTLIVASATAFICGSCRLVEFAPTGQQQQQQQAKSDEKP